MNPGFCGFFEDPDWVDETDPQFYCDVVATDDGACFVDEEIGVGRWIESDLMVSLGDAR